MVARKVLAHLNEEAFLQGLEALPPPHRYLFILDIVALVRLGSNGKLHVKARRPEWADLIPPLLKEAQPYRDQIAMLVRAREEGACLHCAHWIPLGTSWGICKLMPGLCGWLYGCEKFKPNAFSR